jgi:hypothetical protein
VSVEKRIGSDEMPKQTAPRLNGIAFVVDFLGSISNARLAIVAIEDTLFPNNHVGAIRRIDRRFVNSRM